MFIGRDTYGLLVANFPKFMAETWPTYSRSWTLAGVHVSGFAADFPAMVKWVMSDGRE